MFFHVLAAIAWVRSDIYTQVLATRALRAKYPDHIGVVAKDTGSSASG